MLISKDSFRKLIHSIKFIEFEWNTYKKRYPKQAARFKYKGAVEAYISQNKYDYLKRVLRFPFSKKIYLSTRQYREIKRYSRISRLLKKKLRLKKKRRKIRLNNKF